MGGRGVRSCIPRLQLLAVLVAAGCAGWPVAPAGPSVHTAPAPSRAERYCAWYGAASEGVLYFGQAPFWSAMRAAGGDPLADLDRPGPQLVGRFDLARERFLPPLQVGLGGDRSGVWDVLPLPAGPVLFTTFYETAGSVDPETGRVRRFPALGKGLNELAPAAPGEADTDPVLATRYGSGSDDGADGELVLFHPDGTLLQRIPLAAPRGYRSAPKTPAAGDRDQAYWVTTDLLPLDEGEPVRHDSFALGMLDGTLLRLVAEPEIQFVARGPDGSTHFAEVSGETLTLRTRPPAGGSAAERVVVLDRAFDPRLDFAQDIQPASDGRVAVTRWSGRVHVVHADGRVGTAELPRLDPDGLYYTGVLHGERLCVTHCADVTVVCTDAP